MSRARRKFSRAFTLLEVMIAVAFVGIAMLALMTLHNRNLESVMRAEQLTRAAMLAQALMTREEAGQFPVLGVTKGDFNELYPGLFPDFRWRQEVDPSPMFPDIRRVEIDIFYGPGLSRKFDLVEFMHNPIPPPIPALNNPAGGQGANDDAASQGF